MQNITTPALELPSGFEDVFKEHPSLQHDPQPVGDGSGMPDLPADFGDLAAPDPIASREQGSPPPPTGGQGMPGEEKDPLDGFIADRTIDAEAAKEEASFFVEIYSDAILPLLSRGFVWLGNRIPSGYELREVSEPSYRLTTAQKRRLSELFAPVYMRIVNRKLSPTTLFLVALIIYTFMALAPNVTVVRKGSKKPRPDHRPKQDSKRPEWMPMTALASEFGWPRKRMENLVKSNSSIRSKQVGKRLHYNTDDVVEAMPQ